MREKESERAKETSLGSKDWNRTEKHRSVLVKLLVPTCFPCLPNLDHKTVSEFKREGEEEGGTYEERLREEEEREDEERRG